MWQEYPIVGQENVGLVPEAGAERTVNMYPATNSSTGRAMLLPSPGLVAEKDIGLTGGRQSFSKFNYMYTVIGTTAVRYSKTLSADTLGSITSTEGHVGITANQNSEIVFVDGIKGYVYDENALSFTEITSPGFPSSPRDVTFMATYVVVIKNETNEFFVSNSNQATVWNALLNFAFIQGQGDVLIACAALKGRLFLMGKRLTEVWYDAGAKDFPLRKIDNSTLEYGCAATGSVKTGNEKLIWLASDSSGGSYIVMSDSGGIPKKISTTEIDADLERYGDISDATANFYKNNGHLMYELILPSANVTKVLDITEGKWTSKSEKDGSRFRISTATYFNSKNYMFSYNDQNIYTLNSKHAYYGEDPISRLRDGPEIIDEKGNKVQINGFRLLCRTGLGTATGRSQAPEVFLSFSMDRGNTWSRRVPKSMGLVGQHQFQVEWEIGEEMHSFIPRIEYFQEGEFVITGAAIDYDVLE